MASTKWSQLPKSLNPYITSFNIKRPTLVNGLLIPYDGKTWLGFLESCVFSNIRCYYPHFQALDYEIKNLNHLKMKRAQLIDEFYLMVHVKIPLYLQNMVEFPWQEKPVLTAWMDSNYQESLIHRKWRTLNV